MRIPLQVPRRSSACSDDPSLVWFMPMVDFSAGFRPVSPPARDSPPRSARPLRLFRKRGCVVPRLRGHRRIRSMPGNLSGSQRGDLVAGEGGCRGGRAMPRSSPAGKAVQRHRRLSGAPGAIRTRDRQIRRLLLYPAELRGPKPRGATTGIILARGDVDATSGLRPPPLGSTPSQEADMGFVGGAVHHRTGRLPPRGAEPGR